MDGKVVEDIGDRLQAEKGLNEVVSASNVIRVMSGMGVDYHSLKDVKHFVIFDLEFRDDDTSDLDQ